MCACLEAVRHFAGSSEASTLLMRREIFAREGDAAVCNVMRAHPTDKEVQRQVRVRMYYVLHVGVNPEMRCAWRNKHVTTQPHCRLGS